jgi:hypothetical protein
LLTMPRWRAVLDPRPLPPPLLPSRRPDRGPSRSVRSPTAGCRPRPPCGWLDRPLSTAPREHLIRRPCGPRGGAGCVLPNAEPALLQFFFGQIGRGS